MFLNFFRNVLLYKRLCIDYRGPLSGEDTVFLSGYAANSTNYFTLYVVDSLNLFQPYLKTSIKSYQK